jgi:putative transposase
MIYIFIDERCSDLPVATCCRVMKVSTSRFYTWRANPVSGRDLDDALLTNIIFDIWRMSRRSYGSPRVHAELRLGEDLRCSRKRVERLMAQAGLAGIYRRKGHGCTRRDPAATAAEDLVKRRFAVDGPDRLWVMDVTEHPTGEGKVYLGVVVDAWSRRVVGWSIADHIRQELVVDAVQMAIWRRQPPQGQTVAHSDHGSQGGFDRSSQHLDRGGVCRWDCRSSRRRLGRCEGRYIHRAGRRCGSASRCSVSG